MRTRILLLLSMVISFAVVAQTKTTKDIPKNKNYQTLTERISGQWKLDRIVDEEGKNKDQKNPNDVNEVTANQSNSAMQMLEFSDEARYKMNNSTTALDSGNYSLNEQNQSLVLESDLAATEPSEWNITLKNNTLTLVGREAASKRYKYIYSRMKPKQ